MAKNYHVTCHMATSIDGKVTGSFLKNPHFAPHEHIWFTSFYELNKTMKNWICGRVSFELLTGGRTVDTSRFKGQKMAREDFIAPFDEARFAIAIDPDGKLGWTQNSIGNEYPELQGDHIITVLSENVADEYLAYLQEIGVSYLFAGQQKPLCVKTALDKLHRYFGLEQFLLVGGGYVNGSFMQAGLIDTISLIQAPLVESDSHSVSLFQSDNAEQALPTYQLIDTEVLESGSLKLIYEQIKQEK